MSENPKPFGLFIPYKCIGRCHKQLPGWNRRGRKAAIAWLMVFPNYPIHCLADEQTRLSRIHISRDDRNFPFMKLFGYPKKVKEWANVNLGPGLSKWLEREGGTARNAASPVGRLERREQLSVCSNPVYTPILRSERQNAWKYRPLNLSIASEKINK